MGDKPDYYLKKLTKEERKQMKEEERKNGKPKILIFIIILMVAIMAGMFILSYFWSMEKVPSSIAIPVMVVCLVAELIICEISNKMNHKLNKE